jgi:hypothetical protein
MKKDTYLHKFPGLHCSHILHHLTLIAALAGLLSAALSLDAASVTLAWDPPTNTMDGSLQTNIAGYHLFYGTASKTYSNRIDAGLTPLATLTNLQDGLSYYFSAAAYNTIGLNGDFSPELSWTPPAPPPLRPIDHFTWSPIDSPQPFGASFTASIMALDASNQTAIGFTGTAQLSGMMTRTLAVGSGTSTTIYPLAASSDDARTQIIFLANEVGSAGWLTGLALDVKTTPGQPLKQWTIRLKHTPLSNYTSKSVWESSGWTTVHQSPFSITNTGLTTIPFSTPFYFNGTNNLMVDISFNNTSRTWDGTTRYTSTSTKRTLYYKANSTYGDPLLWARTTPRPNISASLPNVQFKFASPVTVYPAQTTGFINGQWTGSITLASPATSLILSASDDSGHTGSSAPFDVIDLTGAPAQASAISPAAAPPADFDDDGLTDDQELIAGTDPYDPFSLLMLTGLTPQAEPGATGYTLQWASVPGRYYTVLLSTNLTATPSFTPLALHILAPDTLTSFTDPDTRTGTPCFYQVQVEP